MTSLLPGEEPWCWCGRARDATAGSRTPYRPERLGARLSPSCGLPMAAHADRGRGAPAPPEKAVCRFELPLPCVRSREDLGRPLSWTFGRGLGECPLHSEEEVLTAHCLPSSIAFVPVLTSHDNGRGPTRSAYAAPLFLCSLCHTPTEALALCAATCVQADTLFSLTRSILETKTETAMEREVRARTCTGDSASPRLVCA